MNCLPMVLIAPNMGPKDEVEPSIASAVLSGLVELWHPALLRHWRQPPALVEVADLGEFSDQQCLVVPEGLPLGLAEDWAQRAALAGTRIVFAGTDREHLRAELHARFEVSEQSQPDSAFFGLGMGYWLLEQLAELMGHANPLDQSTFLSELKAAAEAMGADAKKHLEKAADQLRAARDVLYPSTLHLLLFALWEDRQASEWPLALTTRTPINLVISAARLAELVQGSTELQAALVAGIDDRTLEVCGGADHESPEALLPPRAVFDNLRAGWQRYRSILGSAPQILARGRYGPTALWPEFAHSFGQRQTILLSFSSAQVPQFQGAVLEWPNPAGKTLQAYVRRPLDVGDPLTWFRLPKHLHETMMKDFSAVLGLVSHSSEPSWYREWLALHQLAPVFGQPVTLGTYFSETYSSDHPPTLPADEFVAVNLRDWILDESAPIGGLAGAWQRDATERRSHALAGMARGLAGPAELPLPPANRTEHAAKWLADRVVRNAGGQNSGHIVFNPCSFARTVVVDLPGVKTPLPAPARATQLHADGALVSVELPPLGFSWLPASVAPGTKVPQPKVPIGEGLRLRNEHLEVEFDESTGGAIDVRDSKRRISRLALGVVGVRAGSIRTKEIRLESAGPVVGTVVADVQLLDAQTQAVADLRIRYELGWGVPYLRIKLEYQLHAAFPPLPWPEYLGLRLIWHDSSARLSRSFLWSHAETNRDWIEAPGFLEVGSGANRFCVLTGGLAFWHKEGARQVDLLCLAGNETTRNFEVGIAVDCENPHLLLEDWQVCPEVVSAPKGPPACGPTAWLFDLDSSHIVVAELAVLGDEEDAVTVRFVETRGISGEAQFRCPRQPVRAEVIDDRGEYLAPLTTVDDTVFLHLASFEMVRVRIAFTA